MACWHLTETIAVQDEPWGRIYTGPRADLIAQGLVDAAKLPGDPGNRVRTVRYREPDGRLVIVKRTRRDGEFQAFRDYTADEKQAADRREQEARAVDSARREVAALPRTAAEFRASLEVLSVPLLWKLTDAVRFGAGGYRVSDGTMRDIFDALRDLTAALQAAQIVFDGAERRDEECAIQARALPPVSPSFERFMAGVLGA